MGHRRAPSPELPTRLLFLVTPVPHNCQGKCRISASSWTRLGGQRKREMVRGHGAILSLSMSPSWWLHTYKPAVVTLLHDIHPVPLQQLQLVGVLGPVLVERPVPARHGAARAATGPTRGRRATVSLPALLTGSTGFRSHCRMRRARDGRCWVPRGLRSAAGRGCSIRGSTHIPSSAGTQWGANGGLSPALGARTPGDVWPRGVGGLVRGLGCQHWAASGMRGRRSRAGGVRMGRHHRHPAPLPAGSWWKAGDPGEPLSAAGTGTQPESGGWRRQVTGGSPRWWL